MLCRDSEFKSMRSSLPHNVLWASTQADAVSITRHLLHEHSSEHPDDAQDFEVVQACHSNLKVGVMCRYICGLMSKPIGWVSSSRDEPATGTYPITLCAFP